MGFTETPSRTFVLTQPLHSDLAIRTYTMAKNIYFRSLGFKETPSRTFVLTQPYIQIWLLEHIYTMSKMLSLAPWDRKKPPAAHSF